MQLWGSLTQFGLRLQKLWLVLGDFNSVRYSKDREGQVQVPSYEIRDFMSYCVDLGLVDINATGTFFTWTNKQTWSKTDRSLKNLGKKHYGHISAKAEVAKSKLKQKQKELHDNPYDEQPKEIVRELQHKASIFLAGIDKYEKEAIMDLTGFSEASMPFCYLGVLLSSVYLKVADFAHLLNKVSSTLLTWAGLNLSHASRLEVISVVVQGIEIFGLEVFPISAAKDFSLLIKRFLTIRDALVEKEGSIVEATNRVDSWVVDDTLNTSLAYDYFKGVAARQIWAKIVWDRRIWKSIKEWTGLRRDMSTISSSLKWLLKDNCGRSWKCTWRKNVLQAQLMVNRCQEQRKVGVFKGFGGSLLSGFRVLIKMSREFELKVHYNGKFNTDPNLKYINAEIAYFDYDPDCVSHIELVHCLKKVGVSVHDKLWYKLPELDLEKESIDPMSAIVTVKVNEPMNASIIVEGNEEIGNDSNDTDTVVGEEESENPRISVGLLFRDRYVYRAAIRQHLPVTKVVVTVSKIKNQIESDSSWGLKWFRKAVRSQFTTNVSVHHVRRAKINAINQAMGDHSSQYTRLRDYCGTIVAKKNPRLVEIVNVMDRVQTFERMFLMFDAQKEGFISGCRPVIGLDAYHLKSPFGGRQLMCAVRRDANNQRGSINITRKNLYV
ncbi:hypothetical protein M9H77_06371 [Catharanthus roseus]|uniref:Uncharacterized protein n=1 Tax=Catharanthus roseus TaxID=4058 RepID=A0ACC0BRV9_CATRO|nr:hypothetical protein M9H77_06371 [Catharanthus roseus]